MLVALMLSTMVLAAAEPTAASADGQAKAAPPAKTVDQAVVQGKGKDDPMKIVCRSELPVGSRLPVKKCMTKSEAEMRKFEDRQELERAQGDTYRH